MGAGESVFYPSALSLLAREVRDRHRVRATGTMQFGALVGPALGTLVGGLIMARFGWRAMFVSLGIASLIWLVPWMRVVNRERQETTASRASVGREPKPTFSAILRQRALWGGTAGIFCSNYAFYFVFTWLPLYLTHERGLSLLAMTRMATAFYIVDALSVLATAWLLDAWIARGATINRAYKTALVCSSLGVGTCLLLCTGVGLPLIGITIVGLGFMDGLNSPATCALTQAFAGPSATGRWMGVQNAAANTAGMVAPVLTGYLVEFTGHYTAALVVAGAAALCGSLAWLLVVPVVRPVDWRTLAP